MIGALTLFLLGLNGVDAWALKAPDPKWSFEFKDVSVKEALAQISEKAGVTFMADEQLIEKTLAKKMLHKSYSNKNLDKIIQDIFKKDNCAFTWLYKNNRLNQVDIWFVERGQDKTSGIKKRGGPGFSKKSSQTGPSGARARLPFKQSFKKNPKRFSNSRSSSLKKSQRRTKSPQPANASSSVTDISNNVPGNTTENLKSDTSTPVAESYETGNSTDYSAQPSKTDSTQSVSKTETENEDSDDLIVSKADSTSDSAADNDEGLIVAKGDNQNESSGDKPVMSGVVSKAWLVNTAKMSNNEELIEEYNDFKTVTKSP